jgi:hypothetical protein
VQKIHFKDDGQDILWWIIDEKGVVQSCNMQGNVWNGTVVAGIKPVDNDLHRPLLTFKPGDILCILTKHSKGKVVSFIHPVEKVEKEEAKSSDSSKH